uniref:Uncharacterized protein n=1 Tax=viral metagenome TaxID=1070528 RepID=A0A6C0JD10_9ZZZZ|tara:strand:- start:866 stop:2077 length:1212 start_codon:yes stop_codon:yes gene_type:complete
MILTLNLECLDQNIVKFYEQDSNKSLIQDALIHGYKIVNSSTYGLNFDNSNQDSIKKINILSTENSHLSQQIQDLESQILNLQTKQNLQIQENSQKLITQFNLQKIEQEDYYSKRETEKRTLFDTLLLCSQQQKTQELDDYKSQISNLNQQILLIKDSERNHYELKIHELQNKLDERNSIYSNSSKKGAEGENNIELVLNSLLPNAIINDTHTQSRSGDIRIELQGIQILYENKNFTNNVPKRDIDKFIRDVSESDVNCGIMCSENSGIANRNDLDIEILDGKPMIYLHNTKDNVDKIKIAIIILVNILQNNLELDTSMIQKIKDLVKETEEINKIYNSQKKHLNLMGEQNDKLVIHTRTIKYRLEEIISKCENSEFDERKQKCQHCSKFFMDLDKHIKKNHL